MTVAARCRTAAGLRDQGLLNDFSTHGCCVTMRALYLSEGMRVVIQPQGLEGLTGVVRWIDGNRAGIEFDQEVYTPVVEHIAARHGRLRRVSIQRALD